MGIHAAMAAMIGTALLSHGACTPAADAPFRREVRIAPSRDLTAVLDLLARQRGLLRVSVGDHPHCAGPPVPSRQGLSHLRRVSLQPARTIESCLSWFSVDLFVDDRGRVVAVTLDLWEP